MKDPYKVCDTHDDCDLPVKDSPKLTHCDLRDSNHFRRKKK